MHHLFAHRYASNQLVYVNVFLNRMKRDTHAASFTMNAADADFGEQSYERTDSGQYVDIYENL